jgi:two-component system nitrogen regulation sensor histidine kinase GlnL
MSPIQTFAGFDLLTTAVLAVDRQGQVMFANSAAENLLELAKRTLWGLSVDALFLNRSQVRKMMADVWANACSHSRQLLDLRRGSQSPLQVHLSMSLPEEGADCLLFEIREVEQQLRVDRETRMLDQTHANRELIRNLAHEIKNPLGGIRGAAQLLEGEFEDPGLREYTQVIIKESDRLQTLVDRLLAPHRKPHVPTVISIHEVCERVRSLILAEHPKGLQIVRDYDTSLPDFYADFEQLIQVVLNVVRNATEALAEQIVKNDATIILCTRVVRQLTLHRKRHRLALDLRIVDNGPGIPTEIKERIFFPLISGREGGSGLGLTLAQTFVQQHGGTIDCESRPGKTVFRVLLPMPMHLTEAQ